MTISGNSTVAYTYTPRHTEAGTVVQQRRTTALSSNCMALDDALTDLDALKPTMVAGSDAAAVNEWIRGMGWKLQAVA